MKALGTQTIETERLILRRFVETDAQAMFDNWASRSENLTYVTWNPHLNVEQTRNSIGNWVKSYDNPDYYKWAICLKENPDYVIGDISLVGVHEENSSCEIGFEEVDACYVSLNLASGRVMEKAGMTFWKTIPNAVERKGYIADKIYYQIKK